ncbi:CvpA family protein [Rosistilla oblonga]|uniref:CvpA family protein n=1 Tax=Rosistilla oblonga TaxID=2527990 RepID=UPI003A96EC99
METYDIIMLIALAAATILGAIKGFAWQVASLASISLSYWVAMRFREPFSQQIHAEPPWNMFLAMFILFTGTMIAIWILFRMLSRTIDRLRLRTFDHQLGGILGLAKGVIYCILITMFALSLLGDSVRTQIVQSRSGYYIAKLLSYSDKVIPAELQEIVGPYLDRLDEQLRADGNASTGPAQPLPWGNNESTAGAIVDAVQQNLQLPNDSENLIPAELLTPKFFDQIQP